MKPPSSHLRKGPFYSVAVWWVSEGSYGGANAALSWADALEQIERLRKLGYDKPGKSEIHVFRRVTETWKAHELTDCRAKLAAQHEGESK